MTVMINEGRQTSSALRNTTHGTAPAAFQQTVPRQLVHRAAVSEVFITHLDVVDELTSHVGAQWPRAHSFFGPKQRLHDPMLLAETLRQATLIVAHEAFDVPADSQFVMLEMTYEVTESGLALAAGPADIVLTGHALDIQRRRTAVAGMRVEYECHRDGERVGAGGIRWRCVSPASYARLRGEHHEATRGSVTQPAPVAPELVGRFHESDVVLGGSPLDDTWVLRVDTDHPVMFDHSVDHVPGMMVVEAARQAAQLVTGRPDMVPGRGHFSFDRYVELDEPCIVRAGMDSDADPDAGGTVRVTFEQSGTVAVTADLDALARS